MTDKKAKEILEVSRTVANEIFGGRTFLVPQEIILEVASIYALLDLAEAIREFKKNGGPE